MKTVDFSETIAASDLNVSRSIHLIIVVVIPGHNLGNSQVSVYRTIVPNLVL